MMIDHTNAFLFFQYTTAKTVNLCLQNDKFTLIPSYCVPSYREVLFTAPFAQTAQATIAKH